ncbi:MAG: conjugal transfer protein TraO [Flavobacterium sp.]
MKQIIYIVLMVLLTITTTKAQRMLPKQKGLELSTGSLSNEKIGTDYFISVAMTVNGKKGNYQIWGLEYSRILYSYKSARIPQQTITAQGGYSFFLLGNSQKNISLNFALTGIIGYESLNRGERMLYDGAKILSKDNFIYGAGARLSLETHLSDHVILLLQCKTKVLWNTNRNQFRPSLGIGIKYNF